MVFRVGLRVDERDQGARMILVVRDFSESPDFLLPLRAAYFVPGYEIDRRPGSGNGSLSESAADPDGQDGERREK